MLVHAVIHKDHNKCIITYVSVIKLTFATSGMERNILIICMNYDVNSWYLKYKVENVKAAHIMFSVAMHLQRLNQVDLSKKFYAGLGLFLKVKPEILS